jgi:hypothetical protein
VIFPSMLQLFLIFVGAEFEMLKVVRIYNVVPLSCIVLNVLDEHSGSIFTGH